MKLVFKWLDGGCIFTTGLTIFNRVTRMGCLGQVESCCCLFVQVWMNFFKD